MTISAEEERRFWQLVPELTELADKMHPDRKLKGWWFSSGVYARQYDIFDVRDDEAICLICDRIICRDIDDGIRREAAIKHGMKHIEPFLAFL